MRSTSGPESSWSASRKPSAESQSREMFREETKSGRPSMGAPSVFPDAGSQETALGLGRSDRIIHRGHGLLVRTRHAIAEHVDRPRRRSQDQGHCKDPHAHCGLLDSQAGTSQSMGNRSIHFLSSMVYRKRIWGLGDAFFIPRALTASAGNGYHVPSL